ncbi:MAG: exodeoxyribonuclease VII small subunit [Saprospiraceae bacterium]|nr:exodeoxyribonuclease VII small subunit [Saprospiraceae bacterium]
MSEWQEELSYEEAMKMLTSMLEKLEDGSIPIDQLEATIDRANELVAFCQNKLRQINDKLAAKVKNEPKDH